MGTLVWRLESVVLSFVELAPILRPKQGAPNNRFRRIFATERAAHHVGHLSKTNIDPLD